MRGRLLLVVPAVVAVLAAGCGQDATDVRFPDAPLPGHDTLTAPGLVGGGPATATASAEPTAGQPSPAASAATPVATAPPTARSAATPGPRPPQPEPEPTVVASPTTPRELGEDERAEVGRPYRFRLYTHCGIETTWFDGRWWNAEPPQSDGSGNPPPRWDNPYQDGVIVLVHAGRLEVTGDQGQRADFVPRPPEQGTPPPCA